MLFVRVVDTEMATAGLEDMATGLNISFEEAKRQAMGAVRLGYGQTQRCRRNGRLVD